MAPKDTDRGGQHNLEGRRKQFFLDYYPHLASKLATPEGKVAVECASIYYTDATPEGIATFCTELSLDFSQAWVDEWLSSQLPFPQREKLWNEKYEPRLFLVFDVAAAWVDWTFQSAYLDPSESMVGILDSKSDTQKDAVREFYRGVGQDMSRIIVDYKRIVREGVKASLMDTKREFSNPLHYVKHGVRSILGGMFKLSRLSRRKDRNRFQAMKRLYSEYKGFEEFHNYPNRPGKTPLAVATCRICDRKRNVSTGVALERGENYVCARCCEEGRVL